MTTIEIRKEKLEEVYYKHNNKKAAKLLKISEPTLLKLVRKEKLKLKGSGRKQINVI